MKRTVIKVSAVVLTIFTLFFLYVFARSLPINLSLQGVDVENLRAVDVSITFYAEEHGEKSNIYTARVTDKAVMNDCVELLQKHTYKYQTAGTPFVAGDILMWVTLEAENLTEDFEVQMYRETNNIRDFGIKTMYKGHEYYISRFSEVDEKKLYDMLYAVARVNPVQLEDTVLP